MDRHKYKKLKCFKLRRILFELRLKNLLSSLIQFFIQFSILRELQQIFMAFIYLLLCLTLYYTFSFTIRENILILFIKSIKAQKIKLYILMIVGFN